MGPYVGISHHGRMMKKIERMMEEDHHQDPHQDHLLEAEIKTTIMILSIPTTILLLPDQEFLTLLLRPPALQ